MENNNIKIIKEEIYQIYKSIPLKIANKVNNSICKIIIDQTFGTGFFMNISDSVKFLITNYHIINNEAINKNIEIEIWNEKKMKLNFNNRKYKFFGRDKDITLIELKVSDEIYKYIDFLDYDIKFINYGYKIYKDEDVFTIEHPIGSDSSCGSGKILKVENWEFEHTIPTEEGSSGCPILLLRNDINSVKVIGIHKSFNICEKIKYGTFIGEIIKDFNPKSIVDNLESKNKIPNFLSLENNALKIKDPSPQIKENPKIDIDKKLYLDFINIYQVFTNSLNNLEFNSLYLSKIEIIKTLLEKKIITEINVFIIEYSKINRLNDINNQNESFSLSEKDIIPYYKISEKTEYTFINEDNVNYLI